MSKFLFYIFSSLVPAFSHINASDAKLLFVQILFRHGDRAPINLYPNDPNPESFWEEGLGKLTMLGRKQHYELGRFLRKMYENFTTTSPNEVSVMSSDCDRCMKSAESNLASFFAPDSQWQFEEHLKWQPISVLYIPKDQDKLLETESDCPRAFQEEIDVVNSPGGQAFIAKHKEMFENLTINSGTPIANWTSASYLHDVLFIEKKYNLTIPSWVDPYWKELKNVADLSFYWSFNSPLLHRLRAGPFLQKVIGMMESKIAGDIPLQKIQIYSAHDTNIAVILDALNLFNMKQPPYCATLIFELHELSGRHHAVRLLYLNSTVPEKGGAQVPHLLTLADCTEFCPLDHFLNFTKILIPDDWEKECQLSPSIMEEDCIKGVVIGVCFTLLCLTIVFSLYLAWGVFNRNRDNSSYRLIPLG